MSSKTIRLSVLSAAVALTTAACSSLPDDIPELDSAQSAVEQLDREPLAVQVAGDDLDAARDALMRAQELHYGNDDQDIVLHNAHLARTHASIGLERVAEAQAQQRLMDSEAQRTALQLEARTRERELARLQAQRSEREAQLAERRAASAVAQAQQLAAELAEIEARETARGLVLTLGDVLFNTDSAKLNPGAEPVLDRLAAFLEDNPGYRLLIEGHTDSRGSDAYNIALSDNRADAVFDGLTDRDIATVRLDTVGLGESYPVATNESAAGRQQNRRVEIVISDADGQFPGDARRVASLGR